MSEEILVCLEREAVSRERETENKVTQLWEKNEKGWFYSNPRILQINPIGKILTSSHAFSIPNPKTGEGGSYLEKINLSRAR